MWNLVVTPDGRIGSLDSQRLTSTRVLLWGAVGQAELAERLRKLGARVAVDESGRFAVLPAIEQRAVGHFSKGRRQAERNAKRYAKRLGLEWKDLSAKRKFALLGAAALHERQSKAGRSGAKKKGLAPREAWRDQAAEIGWIHKTVLEGTSYRQLTDGERFDAAYAFAAKHLAEEFKTAAVLDHDVVALWAVRGLIGAGFRGQADIERVVALIAERGFELHGKRAFLVPGVRDGRLHVTNSEQIRIERRVAKLAATAVRDRSGSLDPAAIKAAIDVSGIRFDGEHGRAQVATIYALGTSGGIAFLTGVAGAGKSTLLTPLTAAYHADTRFDPRGREVVGTANSWLQADSLKGAGVDRTYAMDPLLRAIESGEFRPTRNTVLIIEELSQIAPRALLRLLELQAETGMTIRGLGGREQCQSIEAGDSIALLNRALPKGDRSDLLSTVRQKMPRLIEIAGLFRNDEERTAEQRREDVARALRMKRADGTARMLGGDIDEVNGQVADFFLRRRDALLAAGATKGITCSALTNADAAEISGEIRSRLRVRGEITGEERIYRAIDQRGETYDLPIAVGDRLRLFRKTMARVGGRSDWIGSNGDLVTVEGIGESGLVVRNKHGLVGEVAWRKLAEHRSGRLLLGSGWCQTIDSIQGVTSAEHINALARGTAGLTAFKNYPAESRSEYDTWTLIGEAGVFEAIRHGRALGDRRPITTEDLWTQVAKDMSRAPRKPLGIDLVERLQAQVEEATNRWMAADHRLQSQQAAGRRHAVERRHQVEAEDLRHALSGRVDGHAARLEQALGICRCWASGGGRGEGATARARGRAGL